MEERGLLVEEEEEVVVARPDHRERALPSPRRGTVSPSRKERLSGHPECRSARDGAVDGGASVGEKSRREGGRARERILKQKGSSEEESSSSSESDSSSDTDADRAALLARLKEMGLKHVYCSQCGHGVSISATTCGKCQSGIEVVLGSDDEHESDDSGDPTAQQRRRRRRRSSSFNPFKNVTSLHKIKSPVSPTSAVYEIKLKPGDCGITLDDDWLGKSIVLESLPKEEYFAEGVDEITDFGDVLIAIDDESCIGLCLERVEGMLAEAQKSGPYRLRLRRPEKLEDAFHDYDGDAHEALGHIYRQKSRLYEPPEHMDMIYGYVRRYRGENLVTFHFFRESDDEFLIGAVLSRSGKGRIVFHNSQEVLLDGNVADITVHSESARYLGCMVPNFLGNAFTVHDYRVTNPTSSRKKVHHELGLILYETNMLGRVPNSLKAVLPRWDPEEGLRGQTRSLYDRHKKASRTRLAADMNIVEKLTAKKGDEYVAVELQEEQDLLVFDTQKPSWNEEFQAWTLNFNGRVKMASKKNFLLVPEQMNESMDEEFGAETICLRFGKVEKDRFSLDFRHPVSPIQAFAICLSSFSNKLVVT